MFILEKCKIFEFYLEITPPLMYISLEINSINLKPRAMKHRMLTIAIIVLGILLLSSCNKRNDFNDGSFDSFSSSAKTFNYEEMLIDEAMVLIEENINYVNGDASFEFGEIVIDTGSYELGVDITLIEGEDALTEDDQLMIRDTILAWVSRYEDRVDVPQDHAIILVDVHEWEYNSESSTIRFKLTNIAGLAPAGDFPGCEDWNIFDVNDTWEHGHETGGCMVNSATTSSSCQQMTIRLNRYVSNTNCHTPCGANQRKYYHNIGFVQFTNPSVFPNPAETHPQDLDGWYDFLLWSQAYGSFNRTCVVPDELEFHCDGMYSVAINYNPYSGTSPYVFEVTPVYFSYSFDMLSVFYGTVACD